MTLLCESENRSGLFIHQEEFILVPEFLQYIFLIFVLNTKNIVLKIIFIIFQSMTCLLSRPTKMSFDPNDVDTISPLDSLFQLFLHLPTAASLYQIFKSCIYLFSRNEETFVDPEFHQLLSPFLANSHLFFTFGY